MEWHDEGILLSLRSFGEKDGVASFLTDVYGRHCGLVRNVRGKLAGWWQIGSFMHLGWRGRINDQLGIWQAEPVYMPTANLLTKQDRLGGLASLCAVLEAALPEREPYPGLLSSFAATIDRLFCAAWAPNLVRFEVELLSALGFGLDLSVCALTGKREMLGYVSPKTGRAVSFDAAGPYRERLLPLPAFLWQDDTSTPLRDDILSGLRLTGFFLVRFALPRRALPSERLRLLSLLTAWPADRSS